MSTRSQSEGSSSSRSGRSVEVLNFDKLDHGERQSMDEVRGLQDRAAVEAMSDLEAIPLSEILDHDSRPTFILDLDPDLEVPPNNKGLSPIFYNSSLRSYDSLREVVSGEADPSEIGVPNTVSFGEFRSWALSVTPHDASRDIWPTTFLFCGMLWTGSTVRRRFRLISGNKCYTSSSVTSGDLAQGPPPELATGIKRDRPGTERTTSTIARLTSFSKGTRDSSIPQTLESSGLPQQSSQTSTSLDYTEAPTVKTEAGPDELLSDWTLENPRGKLTDHIRFVRNIDWSATPLGSMKTWTPEFRQIANLVMQCPHPVALFWGDNMTMLYNEAYRDGVAGIKHPLLMGTGFRGPFSELWDSVADIFAECKRTGKSVSMVDQMLPMMRYGQGFLEETYFSWCFVPLYGGTDKILGFYNAPFETTGKILAERRAKTLRALGESTALARTVKEFWPAVLSALEDSIFDVPFALLYSVSTDDSDDGEFSTSSSGSSMGMKSCILEGCLGVPRGHPAAPLNIDLKRSGEGFIPSFREAMRTREPTVLMVKDGTLPESLLEDIHWRGYPEPCREATIYPLRPTGGENVLGFLLIGTNPRLPWNDMYESFVNMINRQLSTSLASTILFEEELRRGKSAAEAAAIETQQLSEQLATQTRRFQKMSELSSVGLFILSVDGQLVEANDTWFQLIGLHRTASSVSMESWRETITEESRSVMESGWRQVTETHKPWSGELKMRRPWFDAQGVEQSSWVLTEASPELDSDGQLRGVMGSLTDISHLKWAENLQARRLNDLEKQRTQQNNFIDITSHEMRNPLSAILQCADDVSSAMKELLRTPDAEITTEVLRDCKDAADTIAFCAQHQKSIVDDILTISKLDSDLLVMTPAVVQPLALGQRACKMFEADAQKKGITLTFSPHKTFLSMGVDFVTLDANRVMQVLINLLTNAIKFTQTESRKSIAVRISAFETPPLKGIAGFNYVPSKLSLQQLERVTDKEEWGQGEPVYLGFVVEDTGRGLTETEKTVLFQRFSQASPRTHAKYGGSGLGLFISRQLTELHGGRIGVASEYGVGSKFGFYVRARRSEAKLGESLDATLEPSLRQNPGTVSTGEEVASIVRSSSRRVTTAAQKALDLREKPESLAETLQPQDIWVLIVEDNMVNQKVLRKSLDKLKYKTTVANDGQEALDYLEKTSRWSGNPTGHKLSIILMDVEMPVLDGLAASRRIREYEKSGKLKGHVPIVAVSANVRDVQVKAARESGMDDVVGKPFRIPELVTKINEVLTRYN